MVCKCSGKLSARITDVESFTPYHQKGLPTTNFELMHTLREVFFVIRRTMTSIFLSYSKLYSKQITCIYVHSIYPLFLFNIRYCYSKWYFYYKQRNNAMCWEGLWNCVLSFIIKWFLVDSSTKTIYFISLWTTNTFNVNWNVCSNKNIKDKELVHRRLILMFLRVNIY